MSITSLVDILIFNLCKTGTVYRLKSIHNSCALKKEALENFDFCHDFYFQYKIIAVHVHYILGPLHYYKHRISWPTVGAIICFRGLLRSKRKFFSLLLTWILLHRSTVELVSSVFITLERKD